MCIPCSATSEAERFGCRCAGEGREGRTAIPDNTSRRAEATQQKRLKKIKRGARQVCDYVGHGMVTVPYEDREQNNVSKEVEPALEGTWKRK